MSTLTKEFAWKIAKILKHGYTNFEKQGDMMDAMIFLTDHNITLKPGKEYGRSAETKDYIIEPYKRNINKIAKVLKQEFDIDRP